MRVAARGASGLASDARNDFPATVRLKKRADFQRVYREGVRVTGRHLVVFVMPIEGHQGRFGVTASRKVGGAVVRARAKRRLRELYRIHREGLLGRPADLVVNARPSCVTAPWAELERDFLDSVRRGSDRLVRAARRTRSARPG